MRFAYEAEVHVSNLQSRWRDKSRDTSQNRAGFVGHLSCGTFAWVCRLSGHGLICNCGECPIDRGRVTNESRRDVSSERSVKIHGPTKRLRRTAAIVLVAWVGALLLCAAQPWIGDGHCHDSDDHDADADPASSSHEHDDDAPAKAPHEGGFCGALKSTLLSSAQANLTKPALDCIGVLNSSCLFSNTAVEIFAPLGLRQGKRAISACTPEVCTCAANRSLAPPSHLS